MFGLFNYVAPLIVGIFSPVFDLRQCAITACAIFQCPIYHTVVPAWSYDFLRRRGLARFHHGVRSKSSG